jgi:hypothetical protein
MRFYFWHYKLLELNPAGAFAQANDLWNRLGKYFTFCKGLQS